MTFRICCGIKRSYAGKYCKLLLKNVKTVIWELKSSPFTFNMSHRTHLAKFYHRQYVRIIQLHVPQFHTNLPNKRSLSESPSDHYNTAGCLRMETLRQNNNVEPCLGTSIIHFKWYSAFYLQCGGSLSNLRRYLPTVYTTFFHILFERKITLHNDRCNLSFYEA